MTATAQRPRRDWWWPLFTLALYAYPFPYFASLHSPNELSRLYQARAIVDDHTPAVDGSVRRFGPVGDLSEFRGRLYPNKAPGISFLGAGVYAVARAVLGGPEHVSNRLLTYLLRLFCCGLPTALLLVPLRRYLWRIAGDSWAADAALLTYAFGSLAMTYSLLFFSHELSAVLLATGFLVIEQSKTSASPLWPFLGGMTGAYAVVAEYPTAPIAFALGIYAIAVSQKRWSAAAMFALGALPCALILGGYHQAAYGNPFSTGYAHVQNPVFKSWHAQGFMGVSIPKISSLAGNLFSPARGLFAFAPAFLLAMPGLWLLYQEDRADGALAIFATAFYFFLAAAFLYEAWGWMLGPRHLVPLMPFLTAPLALALSWLRKNGSLWSGVGAGLCASSIIVTAGSTGVYPHIPDEFTAAVAHLIWPLASSGHLPHNLWEMLTGNLELWTWTPWFVAIGVIALLAAVYALPTKGWLVRALIAAVAGGAHVALLMWAVPAPSPAERRGVANIERDWEPRRTQDGPLTEAPVRPHPAPLARPRPTTLRLDAPEASSQPE